MNFTLQGRLLFWIMYSNALTCMYICPLSSQAPRANIAPSGCNSVVLITGSNGGEVHNSIGSAVVRHSVHTLIR
jgi:hypothetical protein